MGYLFLSLALLCGSVKGYCGKKTSGKIETTSDAMMVNTLRMLFCIFIGFFIALVSASPRALLADGTTIAIAALSGAGTAIFTVTWLMSVKQGAYMMVDVFLLIGTAFPIALCAILFDEPIRPIQIVGIVLLVVAGYIICTYNTSIKGKMSIKALALLVTCALSMGASDFAQKLLTKTSNADAAVFNLYTYLFAAVFLGVCCIVLRVKEKREGNAKPPRAIIVPIVGYVLVMAICLFLNSYFKTLSASHLTAAQIYPLYQGSAVVLSMLMSALLFKEKINVRCIVGVALSFVAMIMINVL